MTIEAVKKACPDTVTIMGGPHVTFLPSETLMKCQQLDIVCVGEGERTICELAQAVEGKASLSSVRGIVYRSGNRVAETLPQPLIDDLDSLPFPARHLLPMNRYTVLRKKATIGHVITSRGCPFNCIFCASSLLFGRKFRARSARNVIDEVEEVVSDYSPDTLEFTDDLFTLDHRRVEGICDEMKNRRLDVPWACSSRVDTVSRELLLKMREAGCVFIYFGVESGSQRTLNQMRKGITISQIENAVRWAKEIGIETLASFIIGWPGETIDDVEDTLEFAKRLDVDYAQFSFATPYPGTELYNLAKNQKLLLTENWSEYTAGRPVIYTGEYPAEDLPKLLLHAYKSFYLTPRILLRNLKKGRVSLLLASILAFARARLLQAGEYRIV
jgi:anaerobic magnesium-protoporphyrin IX monomethyl ester cyclase